MPHLTPTQQQKVRKLATHVQSCRQRNSEYAYIERKASVEESAATARIRVMTPLPRISHDKDMNERLKSLRSKYENAAKSAKLIVSIAQRKQRALRTAAEAAHKMAHKVIAAAAAKSADSTKKSTKSTKRSSHK